MQTTEACAVLGVKFGERDAGVLRSAYRRRLKEVHPDAGGDAEATMEVLRAYRLMAAGVERGPRIISGRRAATVVYGAAGGRFVRL